MEQVKEEIPFNYFLLMFNKEICNQTDRIRYELQEDEDDFYILSEKEQLKVFNDAFYKVLINYLVLTDNKEIVVRPEDPIDLCRLILTDLQGTIYKQSLLMSLQFIVVKYLEVLGKGYPTIMFLNDEEKEKVLRVVYDRSQRINTFDSTNMSLEERTDIMVKVLRNTIEDNMEFIPFVRYESRTDI